VDVLQGTVDAIRFQLDQFQDLRQQNHFARLLLLRVEGASGQPTLGASKKTGILQHTGDSSSDSGSGRKNGAKSGEMLLSSFGQTDAGVMGVRLDRKILNGLLREMCIPATAGGIA
jgi:hypothetical protein